LHIIKLHGASVSRLIHTHSSYTVRQFPYHLHTVEPHRAHLWIIQWESHFAFEYDDIWSFVKECRCVLICVTLSCNNQPSACDSASNVLLAFYWSVDSSVLGVTAWLCCGYTVCRYENAWGVAKHVSEAARRTPSSNSKCDQRASFIIEACHMPCTIVGCHLLLFLAHSKCDQRGTAYPQQSHAVTPRTLESTDQ